jgi:hypothetical protein
LEAWLLKQPREVSAAFAARGALRVMPLVWPAPNEGPESDFSAEIVLPVLRATGVAWAAAQFPAQATRVKTVAAANAAYAVATANAYVAGDAAAVACADVVADTAAAAAAAYAADVAEIVTAAAAFWSAVSFDATRVEEGATAFIASSQLWPEGQPEPVRSLWQEMKSALHAAGKDWQVWTTWYDDRLDGRVREEERELAYVRIEDALWEQGPAIVNAEIKRRIEPRVSAPRTGVSGSRRPVFKGFFSYNHRDAEVDPHIVEAFSSELEKRVDAKLVNARF